MSHYQGPYSQEYKKRATVRARALSKSVGNLEFAVMDL